MLNFWGSQFSGIEKKMCNFQKYSDIIIRFCWWVGDDDGDADGEMIFSYNTLFPNVFDRYMSLGPLISLAHLFSHLIGQYIKPRNVFSWERDESKNWLISRMILFCWWWAALRIMENARAPTDRWTRIIGGYPHIHLSVIFSLSSFSFQFFRCESLKVWQSEGLVKEGKFVSVKVWKFRSVWNICPNCKM